MVLAIFFHLGGDIDMLSPFLLCEGESANISIRVLVSEKLLTTNPRLTIVLAANGLSPDFIIRTEASPVEMRDALSGCHALLTASETSLPPHRMAHALTLEANELGLRTATLQHGVENVGITYFDERQGAEVVFAAQEVLTWGGISSLLPPAVAETRAKVRNAGYPGPSEIKDFTKWRLRLDFEPGGRPVIGVFENLHWTRFSERYRMQFLSDLDAMANAFPELYFLLKPHPEGRWFTDRFSGPKLHRKNVMVADPMAPVWRLLTAPALMPLLSGVITTPSKVALDAAFAGVATAVASYDGRYDLYKELPALRSASDWREFLEMVVSGDIGGIDLAVSEFLARTVSGTRTACGIVENLMRESDC